ncbi:bifunctional folylpolyglutamate synthase/dihydrofolate synthase [Jannaschia ovalis]|uniref:Dihydrofolate synthase/folylpolyglutamate synthase n=1 Tax=Jannaschia ovalis TaxID=3038773 RepID=A0ABY8L9E4_9RHOB|nr:folylpolyglutamate synthase/dihydrofolate synthase family protein [Jannaschia sp. GRR-S6-38]WGH77237.1 bifunctional folylpolyglutamate synthase/dihydrofolate synthase [Jannaschia sp. GRR-S6-38]
MIVGSDTVLDRLMALHPKVIDLVLDRVHRLLAALGHPETRLPPVIHIAGTNGKGSTLAMIRAGLEGTGATCHAYTSPHLARFHERIRLAGTLIGEAALTDLLEECEAANDGAPITYFEITTCAALLAFARTQADWTLLEVGLGGRLDATNVVVPRLTVITPVSMDHEAYLGDTLAKIAAEKAGILKPGVPCIVGPQADEALEVIEYRAARLGVPLQVHGQHWHVTEENGGLVFQDETGLMDLPMPRLIGRHQVQNAGMAVAALRALGRAEGAAAAMRDAHWPARMQRLKCGPLVDAAGAAELWLDGGHNPAAGAALAEALTRLPDRPLHLVCGMLNTKDAAGYMAPLAPRAVHLHAVSIPGEANTLTPAQTRAAADRAGIPSSEAASVAEAVAAITAREPGARILICGSLYLAGRILRDHA